MHRNRRGRFWVRLPAEKKETVSPTARHCLLFFRSRVAQALSRGDGPATPYMHRHNNASIRMIWFKTLYPCDVL